MYAVLFVTPGTVDGQTPLSMVFSRKGYGVDCHALLRGTFLTEGPNPHLLHLLHCRQILYHCTNMLIPPIVLVSDQYYPILHMRKQNQRNEENFPVC